MVSIYTYTRLSCPDEQDTETQFALNAHITEKHITMRLIYISSPLLLASTVLAKSSQICPVLGRQFPAPTALATEPAFLNATASLERSINDDLKTGPYNITSFSIGMFSSHEAELVYEFHHTDDAVRNTSAGTRNVDKDTVYRLGSISKLLTVYLFLIREGGKRLHDPVTDFLPELSRKNSTSSDVGAIMPKWEEITVGELASHLGGLTRDCEYLRIDSHLLTPWGSLTWRYLSLKDGEPQRIT